MGGIPGPARTFYFHLFNSLAQEFEVQGWKTFVCPTYLDDASLYAYCVGIKPDVVFEINNPATDSRRVPAGTKHITWIQDPFLPFTSDDIRSDIIYFILDPRNLDYQFDMSKGWKFLVPGVNPKLYFYKENVEKITDLTFAGYIPEYKHPAAPFLYKNDLTPWLGLSFGEFISEIYPQIPWVHGDFDYPRMMLLINQLMTGHLGSNWVSKLGPRNYPNFFGRYIPRLMDRKALIEQALRTKRSFRIYGTETWETWEKYMPYYQGYLVEPWEMREVYQSTWISLHANMHGWGMHFRVLDIMGSGGVVTANISSRNRMGGGIENYFEPNVHYIPFDMFTLHETLKEALADKDRLLKMGAEAHKLVTAKHTWKHRAQQIMNDLAEL